MGRRPAYAPLHVYMNNRCVGMLTRQPSGAIEYTYDTDWLDWEHAMPLSLSLPLRENPYRGEPVSPSSRTCCLIQTSYGTSSPKG